MPAFDTANQPLGTCGMYLRPYADRDFRTVYALDRLCFDARFRFSEATMRRVLCVRDAALHVACEADEKGTETVVGFCAGNLENRAGGRVGYISTLDVAPASRRQGIGHTLLLAAERDLRRLGAGEMRLHVFMGNAAAIHLYEAAGYALLKREPNFYAIGGDALEYGKVFTP